MEEHANFQADTALDIKSISEEDGDLVIEGYASDFGMDRQGEAFEDGAFESATAEYMKRNPILLFHHQGDKALGKVMEWDNRPDGAFIKARVDKPSIGSWAEDVFNKIKSGTIKSFSVGGIFHRRRGADGKPRIHRADIAEVSVTPLPVNPRTQFGLAAAAGKAFGDEPDLDAATKALTDLDNVFTELAQLAGVEKSDSAS